MKKVYRNCSNHALLYAVAMKISVALHDVRSAHNVGSVFRTADAAGVGMSGGTIFLCGYTPAPLDRFGRPRADIAKVALGAEKNIHWESAAHTLDVIKKFRAAGGYVVAIEQGEQAVHITKVAEHIAQKPEVLFVFGNETTGLPADILKICDTVAYIPMRGEKESLNVSVSVAVALYLTLPDRS